MVRNTRREYTVQRCQQPALLWMQRGAFVDGARGSGRLSHAALFDV